ncbi:recQ-mediated genome instability protein 1 isoform X2 [Eucyclogobius newberryi]|uniref:recQ-mediated genome instability protein 1 isoform X2 n=1 Tax=Eucyclogobius newberryi TaxID=166745 RepID=UPI003B5C424B
MAPEAQMVVRSAQGWLQSSCQVRVPFAWLEACVQWLQEEAGGAGRLTQQQINKQIDSALDVSQPAYGQLQKWKGTDCANDEVSAVTQFTQRPWESRPTRVLLLQVTDGVQNMEAMEYQPISALSASLRPGVKLRLQGDIPCRLGMMLLAPTNVKLLGGEVDDLVDRNNQARLLCRTLGLPEEEEPQRGGEEPPPARQDTLDLEDLDLDDQELLAGLEAQEQGGQGEQRGQGVQRGQRGQGGQRGQRGQGEQLFGVGSAPDGGYASLFESTHSSGSAAARIHSAAASSRNEGSASTLRDGVLQNSRAGSSVWAHDQSDQREEPLDQNYSTADADFPDEDFDDLPLDELDSVILQGPGSDPPQTRPQNQPKTAPPRAQNPIKTEPGYHNDFMDEDLEFIEEMEATSSNNPPNTSTTGPTTASSVSLTSPPFSYIRLLDDMPNKPSSGSVEIVVKAFIVTLIGKLTSGDGLWKVGATISDGTGYLDVELSDGVLRGLLGFSVAEKAALKRDPARKGELEAGMRRCQEGLVDMCCVMTLRVDLGGGKALVTKAEPVNEQDLQALDERVKASEGK